MAAVAVKPSTTSQDVREQREHVSFIQPTIAKIVSHLDSFVVSLESADPSPPGLKEWSDLRELWAKIGPVYDNAVAKALKVTGDAEKVQSEFLRTFPSTLTQDNVSAKEKFNIVVDFESKLAPDVKNAGDITALFQSVLSQVVSFQIRFYRAPLGLGSSTNEVVPLTGKPILFQKIHTLLEDLPGRITILFLLFDQLARFGDDVQELIEEIKENGPEELTKDDIIELARAYCKDFDGLLEKAAIILGAYDVMPNSRYA